MGKVKVEALRLAAADCRGQYGTDHVVALRALAVAGLVRAVRTRMSAFYRITAEGRRVLRGMSQ